MLLLLLINRELTSCLPWELTHIIYTRRSPIVNSFMLINPGDSLQCHTFSPAPLNAIKLYLIQRCPISRRCTSYIVYIFDQSETLATFSLETGSSCNSTRPESLQRRKSQEFLLRLLKFLARRRRPGAKSRRCTRQARSPAGDEVTGRRVLPAARRMELVDASSIPSCVHSLHACSTTSTRDALRVRAFQRPDVVSDEASGRGQGERDLSRSRETSRA